MIDFIRNDSDCFFKNECFLNTIKTKIDLTPEQEKQLRITCKFLNEVIFRDKLRQNGDKYSTHLFEVVKIICDFPDLNINKIFVAFLHDVIEDSDYTFENIKSFFGTKTALGVQALSKEKIIISDEKYLSIIKESKILDKYGNIKKEIKIKNKNGELSQIEKKALNIYVEYKKERNEKYFSRFESLEKFYSYLKKLYDKKFENGEIDEIDDNELRKIAKNCLDIKYADRIHNLMTQWNPNNIKKIDRKIEETEKYLLNSAKNNNSIAYNLLITYIQNLKNKVLKLEEQIEKTKKNVEETFSYNISKILPA